MHIDSISWVIKTIYITKKLLKIFLGGDSGGVTPVPIPNTEVKPVIVDGTAEETLWESRKLPGLNLKPFFN